MHSPSIELEFDFPEGIEDQVNGMSSNINLIIKYFSVSYNVYPFISRENSRFFLGVGPKISQFFHEFWEGSERNSDILFIWRG